MITVMGATGDVGRRVVHRLLDAGEQVRAVGFSADTAALHVELGRALSAGTIRSHPEFAAPRAQTPTRFADVVSELLPARRAAR